MSKHSGCGTVFQTGQTGMGSSRVPERCSQYTPTEGSGECELAFGSSPPVAARRWGALPNRRAGIWYHQHGVGVELGFPSILHDCREWRSGASGHTQRVHGGPSARKNLDRKED